MVLGAVVLAFSVAIPIAKYHLYVHAMAWHCLHGDHAQVAGHTVTLPLLWWEEKDPSHWDTYLLGRACAGMPCLPTEINVSHVIPAFQSQVKDSDQETLELVQERVSLSNARLTHNSQMSGISSLLIIKAKSVTLYCSNEELSVSGRLLPLITICSAPRIPYSFDFFASVQQQEEVKSILSTLE